MLLSEGGSGGGLAKVGEGEKETNGDGFSIGLPANYQNYAASSAALVDKDLFFIYFGFLDIKN